MSMKKLCSTATLFFLGLTYQNALQAKNVDVAKSTIHWEGAKAIGSTHNGQVKIKSGNVVFKNGEPQSADIVVDMTTITCEDIKEKKWNDKLVGHLNSDDFFGVKKHKEAMLKVTQFTKVSNTKYQMLADLTIKGKTQEKVKLDAEITKTAGNILTVDTKFEFDRAKFDVKYGSKSFFEGLGDKLINDEIKMKVSLSVDKSK